MNEQETQTILIIDNDAGVVKAIETRLALYGYHCVTASTGAQGLAACDKYDVDLVITDLNMPCIDGVDFINKFRACSDAPVIVVTGFAKEYTRQMMGYDDIAVITKPFKANDLIDLVMTELTMYSMRRAG